MRDVSRRKVWYKNKKIIGAGLLLILLAAILGLHSLNGVAGGSIDNSANFQAGQTPKTPQLIKVSGQNISFTYNDSFRVSPSQKPASPQLENFNYVTKQSPFWQLAVGVRSLPSNNLADDGSYQARANTPKQYKLSQWPINGRTVPVFSDETNPYSKAAFVQSSGRLATIALSGGGDSAQMDALLQTVVKSLEWKN